MSEFSLEFLGLRIFISIIGIIGNVLLILSIMQTKVSRLKSFEVFLLGLAISNLEEIVIVDIYDITVLKTSAIFNSWSCKTLKFLTAFGEIASIFFTVLISVFRYQKLKDAERRVNLPIFLDSIRCALAASGVCVILAILLSVPIYIVIIDNHNLTSSSSGCPSDFFQCHLDSCPALNRAYKYLFIMACNLLPLVIVTVTSCLILKVLLDQNRTLKPVLSVSGLQQPSKNSKRPKIQRSTVAVMAAMGLFQVEWTFYLILHLAFTPYDFDAWSDLELFISTSYTTISPYVYGIGNNLFSMNSFKNIMKR
ncbi:gonadotropin-releasing hormone receptor [Polymixia lowei]